MKRLSLTLVALIGLTGFAQAAGDQACCHGAYHSGIRAAREIAGILQ